MVVVDDFTGYTWVVLLKDKAEAQHPSVASVQTSRPLELLHIDLMGPARVQSLGRKKYILVVVDDFTRYT